MGTFTIGDRAIGPGEPTFVIAEAGSNHNGNLATAKKLIDVAADAGADAVKFQTFRAEDLYVDDRDLVDDPEDSTYALLERLEQPYEWIPTLHEYCDSQDILFMSSPFDKRSAVELTDYVPAFKIASFTLSHTPFLEYISKHNKPIILSTGAHEREDIEAAVTVLRENGVDDIALLHCVSSYPTPIEKINVRAVDTLKQEFDTVVGLSDHTVEPATAPSAAVALGASVIEKHFTLDNEMEGPDHSFALEPDELEEMISSVRQTEHSLGSGEIQTSDIESGTIDRARRGIFAVSDIGAGEPIDRSDIKALRPGDINQKGLSPKHMQNVVGSKATKKIKKGQPLAWEAIDTEKK